MKDHARRKRISHRSSYAKIPFANASVVNKTISEKETIHCTSKTVQRVSQIHCLQKMKSQRKVAENVLIQDLRRSTC